MHLGPLYQPRSGLQPPADARKLDTNLAELLIRSCDVVLPVLDMNDRYSDVAASLTTCQGTHLHLGKPHQTRCGLQPPDTSSKPTWRSCSCGAQTWLL